MVHIFQAFALIEIEDIIDFQNFENNHDELKGTFIHEYCHYLQDVSTPVDSSISYTVYKNYF